MTDAIVPDTAWEIVEPGLIHLPTTQVFIRRTDSDVYRYHVFAGAETIERTSVLAYAKLKALDWVRDQLLMGIVP